MSNFKGTKGKWGYDIDENNNAIDLILPNDTVISHSRNSRYLDKYVIERFEMNANMKLIACAPEMLDLLEKCERTLREIYECDTTEIDALIKKATTI